MANSNKMGKALQRTLKSRSKAFLFRQAFTEHWFNLPPVPLMLTADGAVQTGLYYIRSDEKIQLTSGNVS